MTDAAFRKITQLQYRCRHAEQRVAAFESGKEYTRLRLGMKRQRRYYEKLLRRREEEIARLYKDQGVTKILTIESSGIPIAISAGFAMGVPVVYAKKNKSSNVSGDVYSTPVKSFTHGDTNNVVVTKEYLTGDERVLIVDDFLAHGSALTGLIDIVDQAGATLVGCAAAIEKGFQMGGDKLRKQGYRVESLAIVDEMTDDGISIRKQ